MTGRLADLLFSVTNVLLLPVVVALLVITAATIWMAGGLLREAIERARYRARWRAFLAELETDPARFASFSSLRLGGYPARLQAWFRRPARTPQGTRKFLDDLEIQIARRMSALTFATRLGPMLGLVGTLLPLGPALRGLAADELGTLASNLEVAFATTVLGLLVGGISYAASVVRRNWYEQDISDMEFVVVSSEPDARNGRPVPPALESAHA